MQVFHSDYFTKQDLKLLGEENIGRSLRLGEWNFHIMETIQKARIYEHYLWTTALILLENLF